MLVETKNIGITEIASQFGFKNHSAFSRAFKKQFAISPSKFRQSSNSAALSDNKLTPYLKTVAAKNKIIEVTLEELPSLWLNFKEAKAVMSGHDRKDNFIQINRELKELSSLKESSCFGLVTSCTSTYSTKHQQSLESFESLIYGRLYKSKQSNEWSDQWFEVEAGLWVVCTHEGANEYTYQTWNNLIRSWLPESGYVLRDTIHFGLYPRLSGQDEKANNLRKKIYLPIK